MSDKELKAEGPVELSELELARQQAEEYLNGWKRAQADYANLEKQARREKEDFAQFASAGLITELLPIVNNFQHAFASIPEAEQKGAWVVGFSHIRKQLEDFLTAQGLEMIKTVGEKFNPEQHEAVESLVDADSEEGTILKEISAGYLWHGRVIQAARVVVSKKE